MTKEIYNYERKIHFLTTLYPTAERKIIEETFKQNKYNMFKTSEKLEEEYSPASSPEPLAESKNESKENDNKPRKSFDEERKERETKEILFECLVSKRNSIVIKYTIPIEQMTSKTKICLYDKYHGNNKNYLQCISCTKKPSAFIHFTQLKRGQYNIKLFLDDDNQEKITKEIIIGNELKPSCDIATVGKQRFLHVRVLNPDQYYWIGLYNDSSSIQSNSSYLLCTSYLMNTETIINISHLPTGSYTCCLFTKDSTEGYFFKTYHSCGSTSFIISSLS